MWIGEIGRMYIVNQRQEEVNNGNNSVDWIMHRPKNPERTKTIADTDELVNTRVFRSILCIVTP